MIPVKLSYLLLGHETWLFVLIVVQVVGVYMLVLLMLPAICDACLVNSELLVH